MPIDPNIAMGVRPVQTPNILANASQASQLQTNMMQNAAVAQEMEGQNALRKWQMSGGDLNAPDAPNQMLKMGVPLKAVQSFVKTGLEQRKLTGEVTKQDLDITQRVMGDLANNPSNENITANIQDLVKANRISPTQAQSLLNQALQVPVDKRSALFTNMAIDAKTKYQGDISKRGQDLTDARARDRLAQETATGSLTPETLDMAANVYLKTGQMPPLGFGKSATALRQSVLNRAAQIGGQGADGATVAPADIASNIVSAKQDVGVQTKAVKDFSTGVQGKQVNAFNTAIDHLSTMDKLTDALQGGDVKAFNSIANTVARQTGQPAPTNFDAAKQIVTAEIIKAVVASGGGVRERQEAENNFAAANSPAQLKGVINTYKQLLGGQLNSLGLQYENTTGRKDFDKKLTGDAKKEFSSVRQTHTNVAPKTIKSDAEYDALPPGTTFIDPEGKQRRKP